jgi:ABC-type nitrate/sulfonate/bicarbonate transport system permease component
MEKRDGIGVSQSPGKILSRGRRRVGAMMMEGRDLFRMDLVILGMVVVGLVGFGLNALLSRIRHLLLWRDVKEVV